jgi:hypothetical protein
VEGSVDTEPAAGGRLDEHAIRVPAGTSEGFSGTHSHPFLASSRASAGLYATIADHGRYLGFHPQGTRRTISTYCAVDQTRDGYETYVRGYASGITRRRGFTILSAFVLVEQTELAGDLEDLALVLDHIVAPHRSRLGTAILSDRTA